MVSESKNAREQLLPEDIRRIRTSLGLTQAEAGELLGGGPRAFTKYESGAIQPAASVANLLRLLEADPQALIILSGARNVPIEVGSTRPLEVSSDHIRVLSPRKFGVLAERLLAAEAQSCNLPMDGIHVAAQITVGDGGEDARIEWEGGPERTAFLPARLTQFQLKATKISPVMAGKDVLTPRGHAKPMVKEVLDAGGTYIMLVSHPIVKQALGKHEKAIRDALTAAGVSYRADQIVVRDAAQLALWATTRRPVAAWLLAQTQPGLVGPFHDWSHWAGRPEHDTSPWVEDPRLDPLRERLRALVTPVRGIARVLGPSGIGKSRLVLEALGPDMFEETSRVSVSTLVLYVVESEAGTENIFGTVQGLADAGVRAIIVIDRCDRDTHNIIAGMVTRAGSHLSLLTIDHDLSTADSVPTNTILLSPAGKEVVEGVVGHVKSDVPKDEQQRVAHFAAGFPQAARLIAESWLNDESLCAATDDTLIDRVLFGRRPVDKDRLRKGGMLLSVFGLVGTKSPLDKDLTLLSQLPGAPPVDDLLAAFDDLQRRGVAQARGRLLTLQPAPIAQPLAVRQWTLWDVAARDYVLSHLPNAQLRVRAARQLAILNRENVALDVVRGVCRLNGPFDSLDKLKEDGASEVLSALTEVDAQSVVDLFERVFEPLTLDGLQAVSGDLRRHLVWALEKIAFRADTFEQGARLLLKLAAAENESWGNNSTGQFKILFAPLGGSTEAGPESRFQVLDEALMSGEDRFLPIIVDALICGANTHGGYRTVGAEIHGSRPAMSPWMPMVWKEAWDYVSDCLDRLAKLAARGDALGAKARAALGQDFRALVSHGLIDKIEETVDAVVSATGVYWPEAQASLGDVLVYDGSGLRAGEEVRVRALLERLKVTSLADRVRMLITEMPWDYPVDEQLEYDVRERRQISDVEALAAELLKIPHALTDFLPQLSRGNHRMSVVFGRALGVLAVDPLVWLPAIVDAYAATSADDGNFGLLGGFMAGIAPKHRAEVESFKTMAAASDKFAPTLPFVCSSIGIGPSDVMLVVQSIRAGRVSPARLGAWTFGGVLKRVPVIVVSPLFDVLFAAGGDAYSIGLDLLGMYVHGDRNQLDELRPQLRLAANQAGKGPRNARIQMDRHHFKEVMEWILSKGISDRDAAGIALSLAKQIASAADDTNDDLIKPLLPRLVRDFSEMVWPIFGQALIGDRKKAWRVEHALGDSFSFERKNPAILQLPEEVLFGWCHAHPDIAPAFVASYLPVLTSRDPHDVDRRLDPKMKRLVDEFGDRDNVLRALIRNMYTFGWTGSRSTYFSLYEEPLRELENHALGAVRRWAKKTRTGLRRDVEQAENEDAEREAHGGL